MSELRQNLATRDWVIVAPERLKGRSLQSEPNRLMVEAPAYDDGCPFCPKNEALFDNVEVCHIPHPDPDNAAARIVNRRGGTIGRGRGGGATNGQKKTPIQLLIKTH